MKQLDNYIIERLHLDKDTKIKLASKFVFCVPYNEIYNGMIEDFEDVLIKSSTKPSRQVNGFNIPNPDGFIITYNDAKEIIETYSGEIKGKSSNCHFYKIPNDYYSLKEFEEDYTNDDISIDDFEEIPFKKLI